MASKGGQVFCPIGILWLKVDGSGSASSIANSPWLFDKLTMMADQMMEASLKVQLNSVLIRAVISACGVEIEVECGYTGRNRQDMENQVEMLVLNEIPRMYVLCSIFKML